MIDVCKEGEVSPEQVFFILLFVAAFFIIMGFSRKDANKRVEGIIFVFDVKETAYQNFGDYLKKK